MTEKDPERRPTIDDVMERMKKINKVIGNVLSFLDDKSLCACELVCKQWKTIISERMLWKKLIASKVRCDSMWRALAHKRGW